VWRASLPWHALPGLTPAPQAFIDIVHLQFPADPMAHAATARYPLGEAGHHPAQRRWRQKSIPALPAFPELPARKDGCHHPADAYHPLPLSSLRVRDQSRFHVVPFGLICRAAERPSAADAYAGHRPLSCVRARPACITRDSILIRALPDVPDALSFSAAAGFTDELQRLARAWASSSVAVVGRIPDADLPAYYDACDVFCMPSVECAEAFGIVQVEAMASGRPVVCCELGNGVTWVNQDGETGLVVPPRDPRALAAALMRLRDDQALRATLGQQARRRALELFDAGTLRTKTLAVYRHVLSS
jgi:rhamnosyl/mannosyltransferase